MAEPLRVDRSHDQHGEVTSPRQKVHPAVARARERYDGSLAESILAQLRVLRFGSQARLFAAGMLVSLLPLLVLVSAFVKERVDDDIALHLGLDRKAAAIASHLFKTAPASLNVATITSLVFVIAGVVAMASSIQEVYEKVFGQEHQGARSLYRRVIWVVALCATVALDTAAGKAARGALGSDLLVEAVTFVVLAPFFWWTMHFLLGGRVGWGRLLPSAIATGLFFVCLRVFSLLYFSGNVITDDKLYGPLGTVLSLMTWLAAIGGVIIVGAVAGAAWGNRRGGPRRARALPIESDRYANPRTEVGLDGKNEV